MSTKQTEALKLALEKQMIAMIDALAEQPAQQEPVAIEYWLQDTMESGRWVTTDNMAKATAEKMLSGEYGDVYPQGRIVEPSPPASKPWVGLTQEDMYEAIGTAGVDLLELAKLWSDNKVHVYQFDNEARKIIEAVLRRASAKLREKNA